MCTVQTTYRILCIPTDTYIILDEDYRYKFDYTLHEIQLFLFSSLKRSVAIHKVLRVYSTITSKYNNLLSHYTFVYKHMYTRIQHTNNNINIGRFFSPTDFMIHMENGV